jgi:hypothetical protein
MRREKLEEEIPKLTEIAEGITNIILFITAFATIILPTFLQKGKVFCLTIGMGIFILFTISIKFVWPQKLKRGVTKFFFKRKIKRLLAR